MRPASNLRISGSAYVGDAYYTDDYITPEGILAVSKYTQMPDSASSKYNLAVDYTFRDVFGGDMWARLDGYYVGAMFSSLARADDANPASPDYDPTDIPSTMEVRNLTDARANTFTGTYVSGIAEYWGHTGFGPTNTLARPRTISFKLTKNF